jgi:CSLREA domain-containing protein
MNNSATIRRRRRSRAVRALATLAYILTLVLSPLLSLASAAPPRAYATDVPLTRAEAAALVRTDAVKPALSVTDRLDSALPGEVTQVTGERAVATDATLPLPWPQDPVQESARLALLASITVNTTADELDGSPGNGFCSLREAILNAYGDSAGQADCPAGTGDDTITLPPGTYVLTRTGMSETAAYFDLDITDSNDLTIIGAGETATIVDGGGIDRVFHIHAAAGQVTFLDLTIRNGRVTSEYGGGIFNQGTLRLYNTTVSGNSGAWGGGIANSSSGQLTLTDTTVSGNIATEQGGGIWGNNTVTLNNSTVSGN